ncbi:structural maintenance of chromosomes protein [Elysia marginata]|uniref:Structural maintenance of chromosomes protein n=1 Tax=Elysia marginata TaxID=1093978 RepID=A0AAV4G2E8_9GAST|nr:structural maintenance of chromosomes protein [Elysia marginata]
MLGQLRQEEQAFASKSGHLEKLDKELTAVKKSAAKYTEAKQQYDLKVQEAEQVRVRLEQSSHHQVLEEVNALKASEVDSMRLEIETLQKEMISYEEQLQAVADSIETINAAMAELNEEAMASKAQVKEAQDALSKHKEMLKSYNQEIGQKDADKRALNKESNECGLKIQELNHNITKVQKESKDVGKYVR